MTPPSSRMSPASGNLASLYFKYFSSLGGGGLSSWGVGSLSAVNSSGKKKQGGLFGRIGGRLKGCVIEGVEELGGGGVYVHPVGIVGWGEAATGEHQSDGGSTRCFLLSIRITPRRWPQLFSFPSSSTSPGEKITL